MDDAFCIPAFLFLAFLCPTHSLFSRNPVFTEEW
jgi:hypothetical protein